MLGPAQGTVCPFCGLSSEAPHETQQGCIDALHAEIARTRDLLDTLKPVAGGNSPSEEDTREDPGPFRS